MIFSVVRTTAPEWETAPWIVLCDGRTYLNGIQEENEARAIVDLLNHATPQIIPMRPPSVFSGMRLVSSKLFATKRKGMRQTPDSPRDAKGKWIHQRGSILLEFALVLPCLLLLAIGSIDLSLMASAKNNTQWVAQTTAECLARTPAQCQNVQGYAVNLAGGIGMPNAASAITASGTYQSLTVQYSWTPVSPFFQACTLTATASAIP